MMIIHNRGISTNGQLTNEQTCKDGEEVSNVQGHDCQHAVECQLYDQREGILADSQQVTKSSLESVDASSRQFSSDSPRGGFLASRCCCNDADLLVETARSQNGLLF